MKRRHLLIGGAAAGITTALALGWALTPPRQRLHGSQPPPVAAGQQALNGWVLVSPDDRITVLMAKSEMGQGVHTGLAMLLAEEMDADWATVQVQASPLDTIYANQSAAVDGAAFTPDQHSVWRQALETMTANLGRELGVMITGGSTSIKDLWLPMREAGAAARAMLVAAAAQRWGADAALLTVAAGVVGHPDGRRLRFGELAVQAAQQAVPDGVVLKSPAAFGLIGRPLARLDTPANTRGGGNGEGGSNGAGFGIDVRLPGMLYASVQMCPVPGGRVVSADIGAAERLPGVKKVVVLAGGIDHAGATGGVAVIAERPWQALRAAREVAVQWDEGPLAGVSSRALMAELQVALEADQGDQGHPYLDRGDAPAALAQAARRLKADYSAPLLAHMALEPVNCTVQVGPDGATVWAPTQSPDIGRAVVAKLLGLQRRQVTVHVTALGGGFGRRLEVDYMAQAAQIAAAMPGVPVQTLWSREQDTTHDFYRPPAAMRFEAGLDAQGRLLALDALAAGPSPVPQVLARWGSGGLWLPKIALAQGAMAAALSPAVRIPGIAPDKTSVEGAFDQAYEVPAARVRHRRIDSGWPVGFWRAVGHSHMAFFNESFIDECAHAAGADPVAWRLALLAQHPRQRAVLERAAAASGWGTPAPPAADGAPVARGVALHESFGSIVAQVAEVSRGPDGALRVHRVVCAIDCGTPVNPNLIRQQAEGGVAFGLSAALLGEITVDQGRVQQNNFHDQPALRMAQCPQVLTEIIASTAHPQGVGEPVMAPTAPAVANAVFALTGQRLRSLPLRLAQAG